MKAQSSITYSLSRRFSYILTGVVTVILLGFSAIVLILNVSETAQRLEQQLTRTAELAETSLASAVWQLNPSSINDVLDAIFTDDAIVYARVISDNDILATKTRKDYEGQAFSFFTEHSSQFLAQIMDIHKDGEIIGLFQVALSRKNIREELIADIINTISLSFLLILAISITSLVITRRYILHPLARLVDSTTLISKGELDAPIMAKEPKKAFRDEIGGLAESFESMRKSLQKLIGHIRSAGLKIQSSADAMFATISQFTAILEQQSASVIETTATMESVTATVRRIAQSTDAVVNMADQTRTSSQQGVARAEETIEKMQDIQETNNRLLQKVTILGERSENIGKVIQIINDIADQTKLIAFNAALEAVGTKDMTGKRFNIVAIEIRRLADTIIESTQEIETNILDIQQGIHALVTASDVMTTSISEGVHSTERTASRLEEILDAAVQTTDAAKQIATAIQEQKIANEQILLALQEISDGSRQFVDAGGQLSVSADEMTRLAEELRMQINTFSPGQEEHMKE